MDTIKSQGWATARYVSLRVRKRAHPIFFVCFIFEGETHETVDQIIHQNHPLTLQHRTIGRVFQLHAEKVLARGRKYNVRIPLLVMTSGAHRVDTALVAKALGVSSVDRADAKSVRAWTGQVIGGVGPVGHPAPIRTLVDNWLAKYDVVWAAAGHPHTVFPTSFAELLRITGGTAADVGD